MSVSTSCESCRVVERGIEELFAAAGCRGWLCVAEVDGDAEVSVAGDELVLMTSPVGTAAPG